MLLCRVDWTIRKRQNFLPFLHLVWKRKVFLRHSRKLKLNLSGVNIYIAVQNLFYITSDNVSQHVGRSLLSNIIPVALGLSLHFRLSLTLPLSLLIGTWYAFPTSNYNGYPSFTTSVEATCPYILCFAAWPRRLLYMKKGLFCITHSNEKVNLYMSTIQVT